MYRFTLMEQRPVRAVAPAATAVAKGRWRACAFRPAARATLCLALTLGGILPLHAETAPPDAAQADAPPAGVPATAGAESSTRTPPLVRPRLPAVDPELERLTATIAELRDEARQTRGETRNLETANQRLTELNAQLRQEVESLGLELQAARANARQRWLLFGAGLLLVGVFTGVLIKARPRRSAWS